MFKGRNYRKRRGAKKSKKYGKRGRYAKATKGGGGFTIYRKLPDMAIKSTNVQGNPNAVDSTGTCITLGGANLSVGSSAGWSIPFSLKFRLDQLINSTDITGIADRYKIIGAYVRLFYNKSNAQAGATAGMPYVEYKTDHDDATPPTVNSLREKMGVKLSTFKNASSFIGIKCRPLPSREVFSNGLSTAYEVPRSAIFINSAYPAVEHYGIKGVIHNMWLPAVDGQEVIKVDVALRVIAKDLQ